MKKGCKEAHPSGSISLKRPSYAPESGTPQTLKEMGPGPPLQYYRGCLQSGGLVLVQSGRDIWIPLGCISSVHIENYIPRKWDEVAILNGRRSIYNDFVDIYKDQ